MANAEQVKALIKCHAERDEDRFYSVALQVAAEAARKGHARFARELRDMVEAARSRSDALPRETEPIPVLRATGELAGLLSTSFPEVRLNWMSLAENVGQALNQLILEQRQRAELRSYGFEPLKRLLFVGPPGTGKTMAASAVAGELKLPLFSIRLDGLITRFLGETSAKLRLVFDAIGETRGVYFFDEVDALASDRLAGNDVGEIRRVLNSFLQFLEEDQSDSILLAATNHPQLLDTALFRRFESVVRFGLPSKAEARELIGDRMARLALADDASWDEITEAAEGLSHSEIVLACDAASKRAILSNLSSVSADELVSAFAQRRQFKG